MNATSADSLLQCLSPLRLAGPILDKELRVASRRRRLYILRFAYVVALVLVVLQLWSSLHSGGGGGAALQASRLAEMGKGIVAVVVWFQFITGQILAAALLGDAISSEVRQRTLDVLMVTPVRSFQIVTGKLVSKLLQAASLLAISLPMLAVVRVFGGVPWDYLIAGLCVTASAGVFAGALSLTLSISNRNPHHAILAVILWDMVVWGLLIALLTKLAQMGYLNGSVVRSLLHLTNPFVVLGELTQAMMNGVGVPNVAFWLLQCLILLASAVVLLAWSAWRVRKITRLTKPLRVEETAEPIASRVGKPRRRGAIRPVVGSPVAWKERCTPLFKTYRSALPYVGLLLVILGISITLSFVSHESLGVFFFFFAGLVQLLFLVDVGVAAAGAISKEREARTWPILLATPLEAREIIWGKAIGAFRRNLPLLAPLPLLYLFGFVWSPVVDRSSWSPAIAACVLVGGMVISTVFMLGAGLYFSIRLKTTAAATVATLIVYVGSKFVLYGFVSPAVALTTGLLHWTGISEGALMSLSLVATGGVLTAVHVGGGLLFMYLAARRVRRDIF
jgi:ABC-type transport system involved in multi-copper enzyme maturation permease subunit